MDYAQLEAACRHALVMIDRTRGMRAVSIRWNAERGAFACRYHCQGDERDLAGFLVRIDTEEDCQGAFDLVASRMRFDRMCEIAEGGAA